MRVLLREHPALLGYAFALVLCGAVLAVVVNDRIEVEQRLDARDDQFAETDRRLQQQQRDLLRQQRALADAVRRLERLEHPTQLDLQRLFRGLLEAASPRDVRRLVRRFRELGIVIPRRGGDRSGGPPGPPQGP